jgi:hypothetical protein
MPGDGESRKTGLRTLGRLSGGSEGLQVADELPALRLRQLGPDGHSVSNYAVGKDPEKGSGRGLLYRISEQTRRLPATFRHFTMALGAVESEKLFAGSYGVRIAFQGITACDSFPGRFRQFGIDIFFAGRVPLPLRGRHGDV